MLISTVFVKFVKMLMLTNYLKSVALRRLALPSTSEELHKIPVR